MLTYYQGNKAHARELRGRMTEAEQMLWFHLRRDQLGVRFYRQRPLGPYIVDFYSPKARLVTELDGSQHFEPRHRARDAVRDGWLQSQGIVVLRFDDRQALLETEAVLEVILAAVQKAMGGEIPLTPPLEKGGDNRTPPDGSPLCKRGDRGDLATLPKEAD